MGLAKPWSVGGYGSEGTDCLPQAPAQSPQAGAEGGTSLVAVPAIGAARVGGLLVTQVLVPQQGSQFSTAVYTVTLLGGRTI